jgi:hypothetical protein
MPGPVSAALEAELLTWVKRHGLVLWLDLDGHYTAFVDGLIAARAAGRLPFGVYAFRGSHLQLMLELEGEAGGADRPPLVVHLPGFTEESVRATPLLELYAAGVRFRKKLDTLVTDAAAGRVPPAEIEAFRARGPATLAGADAWLAAALEARAGGGLRAQLEGMALPALVEDLLHGGVVAGALRDPDALPAIWALCEARAGLPEAWRAAALPAGRPAAGDLAFALASWALAVEYVDDL